MREYLNIGSSPCDEDCAQVGSPGYYERAQDECKRFIELIRKVLGPEPEGAQLRIKSFPHDFGIYYEVVCYYEENNEKAVEYAFLCESDAPTNWETKDKKDEPFVCPDIVDKTKVLRANDEIEEGFRIYLGKLQYLTANEKLLPSDYYLPDLLIGSDYSGGSVTASNHRVFLEEYGKLPGVHDVYGGHGTYGVAIRLDCLTPEITSTLSSLADYCIMDEDDLSKIEMEAQKESWDYHVEHDFRSDLINKFKALEEKIENMEESKLQSLFNNACKKSNTYWENEEGNNAYIDVNRVVNAIDEEMLKRFLIND